MPSNDTFPRMVSIWWPTTNTTSKLCYIHEIVHRVSGHRFCSVVKLLFSISSLLTFLDYGSEYTLNSSKVDANSYTEEAMDSFREFAWRSSQSHEHASSSDALTSTLSKRSQLSQTNRGRRGTHFRNVDQSKLIEIPLTEDGVIQIIADKETNL